MPLLNACARTQVPELQCYKALVRITDFVKVLRDEHAAMERSGEKLRLQWKTLGGCCKQKRKAGVKKNQQQESAELLLFPEVDPAPVDKGPAAAAAAVAAAAAAAAAATTFVPRKSEATA